MASLQQQYANLRQMLGSDRVSDSDSSVGSPSEDSESENSWFPSGENSRTNSTTNSPTDSPTDSPSSNEEELRPFHEALSKWQDELTLNKTELITKTRARANKEEIEQCQKEVDSLQTDIEKLKQILHIAVTNTESIPKTAEIDGTSPPQSPTQPEKARLQT